MSCVLASERCNVHALLRRYAMRGRQNKQIGHRDSLTAAHIVRCGVSAEAPFQQSSAQCGTVWDRGAPSQHHDRPAERGALAAAAVAHWGHLDALPAHAHLAVPAAAKWLLPASHWSPHS